MESITTEKGQVVIPAVLRRKYGIEKGMKIQWIDTGKGIQLLPIPKDPIAVLRGHARGEALVACLLEHRRRDANSECSDN